jgi:hypothetical protein
MLVKISRSIIKMEEMKYTIKIWLRVRSIETTNTIEVKDKRKIILIIKFIVRLILNLIMK